MTASNVVKASTHTLTTCVGGGRVVYLEWVEAVCLRRTASDVVLQDRLQLGQILQQTSAVTVSRLLHGVVTVNIQKEINIYVEYHYEDGSVCVCVVCVCVCVCVRVSECVWVCVSVYVFLPWSVLFQLNVFYSGCVIVELRDYRRTTDGTFDSQHVLLRPTSHVS